MRTEALEAGGGRLEADSRRGLRAPRGAAALEHCRAPAGVHRVLHPRLQAPELRLPEVRRDVLRLGGRHVAKPVGRRRGHRQARGHQQVDRAPVLGHAHAHKARVGGDGIGRVPHQLGAVANEHLHELRPRELEEARVGPRGARARHQRLARARRAVQQERRALALALEPRLTTSVKRIVAMGGVLTVPGNVSPVASANILGDPHAADIVLGTNWDITLVLADTTRQVKVSDAWLDRVRKHGGISGEFIYRASQFYRKFYRSSGVSEGFYNHDPTAVAFFIDESIFSTEKRAIRVVTDGMSIGDVVAAGPAHYKQPGPWYGIPLASVTTAVEADKVMRLIESTLEGAAIRENFDAVQR